MNPPATTSDDTATHDDTVMEAAHVGVVREGRWILHDASLAVTTGQRWVVIGANGSGKTTLLRTLSLYLHPSSGTIRVLGRDLGTFDVRTVRPRLAYVAASLAAELRPALSAHDVVVAAAHGALETWWHHYTDDHHRRAEHSLSQMSVSSVSERPFGALSSGEQQRVLLARALMTDPLALLLDEPSARLDLGGREQLVALWEEFAHSHSALPQVMVTHHVDEIPRTTTHCALMKHGTIIASGEIDDVLHSDSLSDCFEIRLHLDRRDNGRFTAFAP